MAHSIPRVDMMDGGGGGASRGKRDAERETGSVSDQGAVTPAFYLLESGRHDRCSKRVLARTGSMI